MKTKTKLMLTALMVSACGSGSSPKKSGADGSEKMFKQEPQIEQPKVEDPRGTPLPPREPIQIPSVEADSAPIPGSGANEPVPVPVPANPIPGQIVIPVFGVGGVGVPAVGQECYKVDPYICEMENAVLGQINGFRASQGLPGLFPDFQQAFSAREWSFQQAAAGRPALSPLPDRLAVMVAEFGGAVRFPNLTAENIGGVISTPVPDVAFNANSLFQNLLRDPSAAANIVGPYNAAGVGIVQRGPRIFLTILFAN